MNRDEIREEVAACAAEYHQMSFCSHMDDDRRSHVWSVIHDIAFSAILAFEERVALRRRRYAITFSNN